MTDIYQTPQAELEVQPTQHTYTGYGSLEKGIRGDYELHLGNVVQEAWSLVPGAKLTIHLGLALYMAVYLVITIGISFVSGLVLGGAGSLFLSQDMGFDGNGLFGVLIGSILLVIFIAAASAPLTAGLFMMGVRRAVGAPIQATTVLGYWGSFIPLAVALISLTILIYLGMLFFVLPGLFLAVSTCMTMQLIADKKLGAWRAMVSSIKGVTKKWFTVFGIIIVVGLINSLPMIVFMVGAFSGSTTLLFIGLLPTIAYIWIVPFSVITFGVIYRNMFGYESGIEG